MARLWGRGDGLSSIEGRMRAERARPSRELERAIVDRIGRPAHTRGLRLALGLLRGPIGRECTHEGQPNQVWSGQVMSASA